MNQEPSSVSEPASNLRPTDLDLRADKFSYIGLGLIWLLFCIVMTFLFIRDYLSHSLQMGEGYLTLGLYVLLGIVILTIRSFRITVRDGVLSQRFLWMRRSVKLSQIKKAEMRIKSMRAPRAGTVAVYVLDITPFPEAGIPPFSINVKFISGANVRLLLESLGVKMPTSLSVFS